MKKQLENSFSGQFLNGTNERNRIINVKCKTTAEEIFPNWRNSG